MRLESEVGWLEKLFPRSSARRAKLDPAAGVLAFPKAAISASRKAAGSEAINPRSFPRFQSTASDQFSPNLLDRVAAARMRLRSAFTPSQPIVDRRMFAGRVGAMTSLIRAIEEQQLHVVMYGSRGIGKTSLLHVLAQAAREARYQVVYISCGAASDLDETVRAIAAGIPLLFHAGHQPTDASAERGGTFADLLPPEKISVRAASDLLTKVVGTRVLVVLDEFDRSQSTEFRRNVAELLKNMSDRSMRVQMVIAGVAADLNELIEHIPSIQRNVFALEILRMTEGEVRQLIKNGETLSGLEYDGEVIQFISNAAHGLPYLASLLGHHAGLTAINDERTRVKADDVAAAIADALRELNGRITRRSLEQISRHVQKEAQIFLGTLAAMSQTASGEFSADDIRGLYPNADKAAKARAVVEDLVAKGIILEARDDEFGRHFRFLEESVPPYLWLLAAQAGLPDDRRPAAPPVDAEKVKLTTRGS